MAKLEKPGAVQGYLDSIVQLCDGIMVARGDLGVEMEIESVPITQRRIIDRCQEYGKPVIVATQMLESMIESPSPTRAEVSDVATAVFDGADAVMLSAESAAGKYPVEAVTMQQKIISTAEKDAQYRERINRLRSTRSRSMTTTDAITGAARVVAEQVGAKAIVVLTKSGTTVARASRERAAVPVIAATTLSETARYLQLSWGVDAILIDQADFTDFDGPYFMTPLYLLSAFVYMAPFGLLKKLSFLFLCVHSGPESDRGLVQETRHPDCSHGPARGHRGLPLRPAWRGQRPARRLRRGPGLLGHEPHKPDQIK
jgi:hypothetical protein